MKWLLTWYKNNRKVIATVNFGLAAFNFLIFNTVSAFSQEMGQLHVTCALLFLTAAAAALATGDEE